MDASDLLELRDRLAVHDVVARLARALDTKDWALCRSCFTAEIDTDYADLRGEPPARVRADDYVARRRDALEALRTLHLGAGHEITVRGDEATCVSAMVIYRTRPDDPGGDRFDTFAHYTHRLVRTEAGWKIRGVAQTVLWNAGNPAIHPGVRRRPGA